MVKKFLKSILNIYSLILFFFTRIFGDLLFSLKLFPWNCRGIRILIREIEFEYLIPSFSRDFFKDLLNLWQIKPKGVCWDAEKMVVFFWFWLNCLPQKNYHFVIIQKNIWLYITKLYFVRKIWIILHNIVGLNCVSGFIFNFTSLQVAKAGAVHWN